MTHTYALLEVSASTFEEIERKLREAHYSHSLRLVEPELQAGRQPIIDMHGIALKKIKSNPLDTM